MATTKIDGNRCPKCGRKQDLSTSVENDSTPKPGDISICIGCIAVCRYDQQLKLALLTEKELEELKKHKEQWTLIQQVQSAVVSIPSKM